MTRPDPSTLPYRPCVGIVLLNRERKVWIGRRFDELVAQEVHRRWQMPQGGIDKGEDPRAAAFRELYEETGVANAEIIAEAEDWIAYDLPASAVGKALRGKYRGQRQKWFAMQYLGDGSDIDLAPDNHAPEFDAWRWAAPAEVLDEIVPFKRAAYEAVFLAFQHILT